MSVNLGIFYIIYIYIETAGSNSQTGRTVRSMMNHADLTKKTIEKRLVPLDTRTKMAH